MSGYVQYCGKPVVFKPPRMSPTICLPSYLAWKFYHLAQEIDRTIVHELIWGKGVTGKPMQGIMG